MKYVIARSEGPKYNGSKIGCLTPGKKYEVLHMSYQNQPGYWVDEELIYNPRNPKFYIRIKEDDNGRPHDIWNDYFLSTEEMRDIKIEELGI